MRNERVNFCKKKILNTFSSSFSYPKSTPRIFQPPLTLFSLSLFSLYTLCSSATCLWNPHWGFLDSNRDKDSFSISFQSFFFHSTTGFFCKKILRIKKSIELEVMEAGSNCCSFHSIPCLLFPVFVFSFIFFHFLSFFTLLFLLETERWERVFSPFHPFFR